MAKIKTNLRTQITDTHLEDQLRLRVTQLHPNIELFSSKKQIQICISLIFELHIK